MGDRWSTARAAAGVWRGDSGRYDYGPWVTPPALDSAAQLFNCMGIHITDTKFTAPKS